MSSWTDSDYATDVSSAGNGYVQMSDGDKTALQHIVWYRDGDYNAKHSVHGLAFNAERLNGGGQVLINYGLPTNNANDMTTQNFAGKTVYDLKLPPKFGAAALLSHNGIKPIWESREEALQVLLERNKSQQPILR
jgi:hypothetical protein